jgi:phage gp29-like protein
MSAATLKAGPKSKAGPSKPPQAATSAPAATQTGNSGADTILRLIRPSARDRWMSSTLAYYTPTNVENIARSAMSGNLVSQWMMFDLMEQTWPRLSKNLNELKLSAVGLNRIVKPFADKDEKPTTEAIRRAKLADKALRTMRPNPKRNERDLDGTFYDVLDSLGKGIELSQIAWEKRPMRIGTSTTTLWCPRSTQWVHPRFYGYPPGTSYEDELMLNTREVALTNPDFGQINDLWMPIPEDEFIVSMMSQKTGHPVNGSMLRILGYWWAMSNFTWEWFLNFAQIFGMPIRWATYDPATANGETIKLIEQMLQYMGSMGWAAFPTGTQLELKEAMKSGADNPQKMLLDAADLICDLVVSWESMTSEHGGAGGRAGGTQGQAVVGQDKRTERIQTVANAGAKTISEQLIRAFCRLNFNDDTECPELIVVTKANKNLVEQAQRYQILLQIPGVTISKQQFYEDNELSSPDNDSDVLVGQSQQSSGAENDSKQLSQETASARPATILPCGCSSHAAVASAAEATDQLANHVLEGLTGVSAKWLGGLKPTFHRLIALAQSKQVGDADFIQALESANKEMPELFHKLDPAALASAVEASLGAALVNGAVGSYLNRGGRR